MVTVETSYGKTNMTDMGTMAVFGGALPEIDKAESLTPPSDSHTEKSDVLGSVALNGAGREGLAERHNSLIDTRATRHGPWEPRVQSPFTARF